MNANYVGLSQDLVSWVSKSLDALPKKVNLGDVILAEEELCKLAKKFKV